MLVFVLVYITVCPFKFCYHLDEKDRAGCFALIVLSILLRYVALLHGAVG